MPSTPGRPGWLEFLAARMLFARKENLHYEREMLFRLGVGAVPPGILLNLGCEIVEGNVQHQARR